MKKTLFLLMGLLVVSSVSFSANEKSISDSLDAIEAKFGELLKKEEQQKIAFTQEKEKLEQEVLTLQDQKARGDKLRSKLQKDSEVRWHRDKYKNILKQYDKYNGNVDKLINEKTKRIAELEAILAIMQ